jgi:hypothetical protein
MYILSQKKNCHFLPTDTHTAEGAPPPQPPFDLFSLGWRSLSLEAITILGDLKAFLFLFKEMSSSDGFDHSFNRNALFYFQKLFSEKATKGPMANVLKCLQGVAIFRAGWGLTERNTTDAGGKHKIMYELFKKFSAEAIDELKKGDLNDKIPNWLTPEIMMQTTLGGKRNKSAPSVFPADIGNSRSGSPLLNKFQELKRVGLNDYLPIFNRQLNGNAIPSGKALLELLEAVRKELYLSDLNRKRKDKQVAAGASTAPAAVDNLVGVQAVADIAEGTAAVENEGEEGEQNDDVPIEVVVGNVVVDAEVPDAFIPLEWMAWIVYGPGGNDHTLVSIWNNAEEANGPRGLNSRDHSTATPASDGSPFDISAGSFSDQSLSRRARDAKTKQSNKHARRQKKKELCAERGETYVSSSDSDEDDASRKKRKLVAETIEVNRASNAAFIKANAIAEEGLKLEQRKVNFDMLMMMYREAPTEQKAVYWEQIQEFHRQAAAVVANTPPINN